MGASPTRNRTRTGWPEDFFRFGGKNAPHPVVVQPVQRDLVRGKYCDLIALQRAAAQLQKSPVHGRQLPFAVLRQRTPPVSTAGDRRGCGLRLRRCGDCGGLPVGRRTLRRWGLGDGRMGRRGIRRDVKRPARRVLPAWAAPLAAAARPTGADRPPAQTGELALPFSQGKAAPPRSRKVLPHLLRRRRCG